MESKFLKYDFSRPEGDWSLNSYAEKMHTVFVLWTGELLSSTIRDAASQTSH